MPLRGLLRRIHWRAPRIIVVAFVAALASAIGHHVFYTHLDQQLVDTDDRLFTQQINLAVGTAFAFLFRASLAIAIGATYWQLFWRTLLHRRKPLTLSTVDALAGALGALFDLFDFRAISCSPILGALAVLSWLVPLAVILPPATLSIQIARHLDYTQQQMLTPDFSNPAMVRKSQDRGRGANGEVLDTNSITGSRVDVVAGASPRLLNLLSTTALHYQIPNFPGIGTNKSYQLEFPGTTLQCTSILGDDLQFFRTFLRNDCGVFQTSHGCGLKNHGSTLFYYSWIPQHESARWGAPSPVFHTGDDRILPPAWTPTQNYTRDFSTFWTPIGNLTAAEDAPVYFGSPYLLIAVAKSILHQPELEWSMLNCSLHFATYTATIASSVDRSIVSNYTVETQEEIVPPGPRKLQASSLPSMVNARGLGNLAMLHALDKLLAGYITLTSLGDRMNFDGRRFSGTSGIVMTTSMYSRELFWLNVYNNDGRGARELWQEEQYELFYPEAATRSATYNRSLAVAVEDLYHNMTLSLLSNEQFLVASGHLTNVTTELWLGVYIYRKKNLVLSYGIALLFGLVVCILGCSTVYLNGGSYSNKFSTMLRTTRGQLEDLDALLVDDERNGMDPLPRRLAQAQIVLKRDSTDRNVDHSEPQVPVQSSTDSCTTPPRGEHREISMQEEDSESAVPVQLQSSSATTSPQRRSGDYDGRSMQDEDETVGS